MEGGSGPFAQGSVEPHVSSVERVKQEPRTGYWSEDDVKCKVAVSTNSDLDKDFLCPICIQTMKDACLTACGHSFCYACITTHLNNKKNCPCCGLYLTNNQLFPNFLLNKLLVKASASQLCSNASPAEHLRLALQQDVDFPVIELDSLMHLLSEKKRKAEQEEAETNMEILLEFLRRSQQQKQEDLYLIQGDLQFLTEDISTVEKQRQDLLRAKDEYLLKIRMMGQYTGADTLAICENIGNGGATSQNRGGQGGASVPASSLSTSLQRDHRGRGASIGTHKKAILVEGLTLSKCQTDSQGLFSSPAVLIMAKKRRVMAQFEDLQEAYLQRRRKVAQAQRQKQKLSHTVADKGENVASAGSDRYCSGLHDFQSVLNAFTRYSRLRVIAELRHGDLFHSSNIVSSIEFDRDDEFFATGGVSRRIKVFEFATVVNELADVHCPVVEMSTRSKLSCLSWNKYIKSHIASSDYEGIITVWDINKHQSIMEYEEHEKRAWSVDFSRTDPTMLVSGSDDGKASLWCTRQESSVLNIDMKANICCVKYNPGSCNYVAVGSADHHIHYFDVRNSQMPLYVFNGHRKAVSYVKFLSSDELASASTDSTLRLWDVKENHAIRTLKGHANEKNFVGLTVNSEYIACGSESNEVFVYHKAMSKPATWHRFGSQDEESDDTSHFISAVCWKSESPTMLAANSQGTIKVLVLAP
ncbi:E3 ubiquitin-protein ligase COP1 isoform X1 [Physcomitrium patens]|uniref:E3 ubiquitin-protein ligase COP1 isoform X1 n=1 Tax=Physcomitrium patens TaxID=3218 RepID=UPI003CCD32F2